MHLRDFAEDAIYGTEDIQRQRWKACKVADFVDAIATEASMRIIVRLPSRSWLSPQKGMTGERLSQYISCLCFSLFDRQDAGQGAEIRV